MKLWYIYRDIEAMKALFAIDCLVDWFLGWTQKRCYGSSSVFGFFDFIGG
jgi:hypothetical protein